MSFTLTSRSFAAGAAIPARHTCDGENISPPLAWSGAPAGTRSFALIDDDPDAPRPGGFVHWVLYDIPASVSELAEGAVPPGAIPGTNDYGKRRFDGSCPPPEPRTTTISRCTRSTRRCPSIRARGATRSRGP